MAPKKCIKHLEETLKAERQQLRENLRSLTMAIIASKKKRARLLAGAKKLL